MDLYSYSMKNDEEMTLKQAMIFLGIKSPVTVRKYADNGTIPCRKMPSPAGAWRIFKKSDLVAFKERMIKSHVRGLSYVPFEAKKKQPKKPK